MRGGDAVEPGASGMGTSTRWPGPSGSRGIPRQWQDADRRLRRWRPDREDADQELDRIAEAYLRVLRATLRDDPSAFGLRDAACAAGERLADAMAALAKDSPDNAEDFVAELTRRVGGDGGTMADAALRRAASDAGQRLLEHRPDAAGGGGLAGDLLCFLYQWFFADTVAEFLQAVVAEKVKLAVPVLYVADPGDHIAGWVAKQVLKLVPNPCEEAAELVDQVKTAESIVEDPAQALPEIARRLVPGTVGKILGLVTGEAVA